MDSLVFGILVSIQQIFVRSESQCPDFCAFKIAYVQTIMRSKLHMSRLSCVQNCICPDYRAFKIAYIQTIVRSFFSRSCNFERTTPPCAFILVWTYRFLVCNLNLGAAPQGWTCYHILITLIPFIYVLKLSFLVSFSAIH